MRIDRRDFIRLFGAAVGGAALASTGLAQVFEVPEKLMRKAKNGPGIVTWKSTICGMCPSGCGLKIKTVDGLPVYVKGNPFYPVNSGGVCPAAHGSLEVLFHPERLKTPLKRVGVTGGKKFVEISWNEAIDSIAKELKRIRLAGNPERLVFITGGYRSFSEEIAADFMKAFGSPNFFEFSFDTSVNTALSIQTGFGGFPSYDIANANVVLTLGADILDSELSAVFFTKQVSARKESTEGRVKFVHAGSRQNLTGMSANIFIPVKPETLGAFALGLAYVLIREDMVDSEFIESHTFGYENWRDSSGKMHKGFKDFVLTNYYPEKVSEITGVPSATILSTARLLGNNSPALVIGGETVSESLNGVYSQMAINSLNALLGNFGSKGGVLFYPKFEGELKVVKDSIANEGMKKKRADEAGGDKFASAEFSVSQFTKNINSETYPVEALFLYKGNPVFQALNKHEIGEALKKIPLVVSFDSFLNETNKYADIILPVGSFLEEWDLFTDSPGIPFKHAGIRQPVVEKFHNTRQMADTLIEIASKLGGAPVEAFASVSFKDVLEKRMKRIFDSGSGAISTEIIEGQWLNFIQQRGWHIGRYQSFEEFKELLLENGGWWNPNTEPLKAKKMFTTSSKKFEFYATAVERKLNALESFGNEVLEKLNITARGDVVYLPHYEEPKNGGNAPLKLLMFRINVNRDGSNGNLPLLQEMFGLGIRYYWGIWAEMNNLTAKKNGVKENDDIWISSETGSIKAKVRIIPSMPEDVIAVPFGMGHDNYGKYADGYGSNPTSIIKNKYDVLSGKPAYQSTEVSISKISQGV